GGVTRRSTWLIFSLISSCWGCSIMAIPPRARMRLRSIEPDTPRRHRGPVTRASSPPSRGANSLNSSSIGTHPRATSTTRWQRAGAPCRVPEGRPGESIQCNPDLARAGSTEYAEALLRAYGRYLRVEFVPHG